jgi:selenophosphate synthetase-related protein
LGRLFPRGKVAEDAVQVKAKSAVAAFIRALNAIAKVVPTAKDAAAAVPILPASI